MSVTKSCKAALAAGILLAGAAPMAASAQNENAHENAHGNVHGNAAKNAREYARGYADDRAEIEDLMGRYLFAMDYNDIDAYVETFTQDGELEYASGTAKGRDAIRISVQGFKDSIGKFYTIEDGSPATLRHVLLQAVIQVEGDRAWTRSLWMEMANDGPEDSLKMGTFGIYEDELKRVDGRWLFSKRRILNEFLEGRHSGPENPVRAMDQAVAAFRAGK